MHLAELVSGLDLCPTFGRDHSAASISVTGVTGDSRQVQPGYVFVAISGALADGLDYAGAAVRNGAVAIVSRPDPRTKTLNVPVYYSAEPRQSLALLARRFSGPMPEHRIGVTGTNGKSSVVDFTRQIWRQAGFAAASLGTLGVYAGGGQPMPGTASAPARPDAEACADLAHTTPDAVRLHAVLRELHDHGIRYVALEASSHGLDQFRLDGLDFEAAVFTSFSRDHLDYHANADDYLAAKARLITELMSPGGTVVLNADLPDLERLRKQVAAKDLRCCLYGVSNVKQKSARLNYAIEAWAPEPRGLALTLNCGGERHELAFPLVGRFQAENALAALALAVITGVDTETALAALPRLSAVPGRLQYVGLTQRGGHVYVDYAHTPDALRHALQALRPHTPGQLVAIFGCGGDRDKGKRPEMGRITVALANHAILTDDNPRNEDPAAIRADVLAAAPEVEEIGDREAAIVAGLSALQADDILLIAGKGHEPGQTVKGTVLPFDDAKVAAHHIAAGGGTVEVQP